MIYHNVRIKSIKQSIVVFTNNTITQVIKKEISAGCQNRQ